METATQNKENNLPIQVQKLINEQRIKVVEISTYCDNGPHDIIILFLFLSGKKLPTKAQLRSVTHLHPKFGASLKILNEGHLDNQKIYSALANRFSFQHLNERGILILSD